jgi:hypothetical protein
MQKNKDVNEQMHRVIETKENGDMYLFVGPSDFCRTGLHIKTFCVHLNFNIKKLYSSKTWLANNILNTPPRLSEITRVIVQFQHC